MGLYQAYPEYKDSGVEWLGRIPIDWDATKFGRACFMQEGPGLRTWQFTDYGTRVICVTNITEAGIDFQRMEKFISTQEYEFSYKHFTVSKGDLLLSSSGNSWGKVAEFTNDEKVILNTSTIRVNQLGAGELVRGFIKWFLQSGACKEQLGLAMTGSCQPNFGPSHLKQIFSARPSVPSQQTIANFLDHETAKIDTLIEKQQQLIQLLKEKRQAVISHAVTKGLNPNAPMKDSGVEWFDKVPAEWTVAKLKFLTSQIVDGAHFTPTYVNDGVPFIRVTDIQCKEIDKLNIKYIPEDEHKELIKRCKPQFGDLLLSKNGSIGIPKIVDWHWDFSIFVSLCLLKFTKLIDVRYAFYFFMSKEISEQISSQVKQSTVINLHLDKIESFVFTVPPLTEQQAIADYLDRMLDRFDLQIANAQKMITLSQERRTALISAAVTGKIDVRAWQAPVEKIQGGSL